MNRFPEAGRLSGHVLLDSVIAVDHDESLDVNSDAADLAFQRLAEIPKAFVVDATVDGEDINVTLDLSNILGSALVTIDWLVNQLGEVSGSSREEVVASVRAYLDS